MSENKKAVTVTSRVSVTVNGQTVELEIDEARVLWRELGKCLGMDAGHGSNREMDEAVRMSKEWISKPTPIPWAIPERELWGPWWDRYPKIYC